MVPGGGGRRSVVAVECPVRNALIKLARRARRSAGVTTCLRAFSAICSSVIVMAILTPKCVPPRYDRGSAQTSKSKPTRHDRSVLRDTSRRFMHDENWDLIKGPPARRTEWRNALNTLDVIDALSAHLICCKADDAPPMPDETALKMLHRAGTISLLSTAGEYRDCPVQVAGNGVVVYQPPPHTAVDALMAAFFGELQSIWTGGDALDAAAFALWRLNWIHPFKNGNGRTARSFAYCCLCVRLGAVLPGVPTVIDQIMMTREDYEAAIRTADAAAANNNGRALGAMRDYLDRLLQIQIASLS